MVNLGLGRWFTTHTERLNSAPKRPCGQPGAVHTPAIPAMVSQRQTHSRSSLPASLANEGVSHSSDRSCFKRQGGWPLRIATKRLTSGFHMNVRIHAHAFTRARMNTCTHLLTHTQHFCLTSGDLIRVLCELGHTLRAGACRDIREMVWELHTQPCSSEEFHLCTYGTKWLLLRFPICSFSGLLPKLLAGLQSVLLNSSSWL